MTDAARRLRLLSLMALQERQQMGLASSRVQNLRNQETRQFDMADRLGGLLDRTTAGTGQPLSHGQFCADQFMRLTLASQLEQVRTDMDQTRRQRKAAEQDLSHHHQKEQVLSERAKDTHRAMLRDRAAQTYENQPRRGTR